MWRLAVHDIHEIISVAADDAHLMGESHSYGEYPKKRWAWIYAGDSEWFSIALQEDPESLDSLVELSRYSAVIVALNVTPEGALGLLVGYQIVGRSGIVGAVRTFEAVEDIDLKWLAESLSAAEQCVTDLI